MGQESQDLLTMRTAFLTAYPKIFTDIDNSFLIMKEMFGLAHQYDFQFSYSQFNPNLSLEIEARYKSLSEVLKQQLIFLGPETVIIELAAGLSPRKLDFCNFEYYELDFQKICELKSDIYERIGYNNFTNDLISIDLTDFEKLENNLQNIEINNSGKNFIFISEGLFWYLERKDVFNIASIIKKFLIRNNGCWINADCPVFFDQFKDVEYRTFISQSSNKDMNEPFSDFQDYKNFFEEIGYELSSYKLLDIISFADISSAKLFSVSNNEIADRCNSYTNIALLRI
jgi:O-methyltransferase involved in polyketide biosynthesis